MLSLVEAIDQPQTGHEPHEMIVLDLTGDTKIIWNPDNPVEVDNAKKTFKRLKKQGYIAYEVRRTGGKGEVVQEFDQQASKLIMAPQMVGG